MLNNKKLNKHDLLVMIQDHSIYKNPLSFFTQRVEEELEHLERSGQISTIEKVLEIREIAIKYYLPILLNGTESGSLVLYLLGISNVNPLPAHYVCHLCGQFEWSNQSRFGIDLPPKICVDCNEPMHMDGYDIPIHSIWHNGKESLNFDFLTVPILIDLCKQILSEASSEITLTPSLEMEEIKWLTEATFEIPSKIL